MKMFIREFSCEDRMIEVRTKDFINFGTYTTAHYGSYNPKEEKLNGEFNINDLNGIGWNGEKTMCDFLAKRYKLNNVYSLNDFKQVNR